jgi:D-3-phosphoglycerate dehydrogenase / 2-oxoglutarate reductase
MRALITASFDPAAKARLARHMEVVHEDWKERQSIWFDGAAFAKHVAEVGADVLIVEADLVHAEVLDAVPLKMIGCCRGEPVNIDLELATRLGIPVFHTPGRNADAVADLTVAYMLMLARHLPAIEATYRGGEAKKIEQAADYLQMYTRFTGVELGHRTVGLVGLGAVGREVASRLAGFKARVIAYDPYVTTPPAGVTMSALEPLLREADFVSMHAPVTAETHGLLSAERLALLKPTAYFVNTARAALTDENALYELLRARC